MPADDKRTHIVDTAIRLLETEGLKAFGQTRVAREANVQQGHLTYYFPKKSDLVAAVLERFAESGRLEFEKFLTRSAQLPPDELRQLFFKHARGLIKDKKRSRMLISILMEAQQDKDVAALLNTRGVGQRMVVGTLIGRPPEDPDVDIVMAVMQGLGLQQLIHPIDARRLDEIIDRLQAWLDALPPR